MARLFFAAGISLTLLVSVAIAEPDAIPASFAIADQHRSAAAESTILQVAAESAVPQLKTDETTSTLSEYAGKLPAELCAVPNPGSGNPSSCNQTGSQCSGNQCGSAPCNASQSSCCADGSGCGNGSCDNCQNSCDDICDHCYDNYHPTWTFKAGALVMDRVSPRSTALVVETGTGVSLMNASGFSFNWTGGVDASIIARIGDESAVEVRFFGINDWQARQAFTTTTPAEVPITPAEPITPIVIVPGITPPPNVTSLFESGLYSAEANWRHESTDTISWLAGFRWLQMHDDLGITIIGRPNPTVRSVTDNELCGGQIGADLQVWNNCGPIRIDTVVKAGIYNNSMENLQESRDQVAFAGEIGATIVYQCCEHFAVRFGYELLWLDGVAVATDQIPVTNHITNRGIDTTGNAFYHGAMFSFDWMW